MMFRRIVPLALLVLLAGCGEQAGGPVRIRISLILREGSEWHKGAARWKELVEERTGGRYRVEVIPGARRSNNNQSTELQMVQRGQLEASLESTILLATTDPRWMVFSYPWLFPDHRVANAVCDGPVGQDMLGLLEERGLVGLAYGVNGFRQLTNNLRPIRRPEDLRGLKIRLPQGLPPCLYEHFGASVHHMNFGDLTLALRTGEMHAQENPLSVIYSTKLYEVQKHLTLWDYVYDPIVLCVNRRFWESLPEADRAVLRECAREAMAYERHLVEEADRVLAARLAEKGMKVVRLSAAERERFRRAAAALRPRFEDLVGKDLVAKFLGAVADARATSGARSVEKTPAPR